jgi:transposase InsO family protein
MRFAVDYRALNGNIEADSYTLPKVEEALSSLHGAKFFSSLDMKEAFWSVPLAEHCKQYTAFQTPDGLMQYRRMPMGLKTASAVFARYVDHMIGELKFTNVLAYIDDLLIFSKTAEEHLNTLDKIFKTLKSFNMTLGAKKCTLFAPSVTFLGHVVDEHGIHTDPNKIKAVREMPLPDTRKKMMSALGLLSYYRKFVRGYSKIEAPLRDKVNGAKGTWRKKDGVVAYTPEEMNAWDVLRNALMVEPVLAHPDWTKPFELHCDGGQPEGLGAVLCQQIDGQERVISFASRSVSATEGNYNVWELECLAIVWATRLFRMYLSGATFEVLTDSKAAAHVLDPDKALASGRMLRWALALQEFAPFKVKHRPGARHGNADGPSRNPLPSCTPYGEGTTDIEPGTPLTAPAPAATASVEDPREDLLSPEAFFGSTDESACNATEFAEIQAQDSWIRTLEPDDTTTNRYFRREDGLWMRKAPQESALDQVLVPVALRAFVCRRYHGLPVSGHVGLRRTFKQIGDSYYWPGMYRDVKRWVSACLACRQRKTPRPLKAGTPGAVSTATRPWQTVSIDIVSTGTKSSEGHSYILTVLDTFTRYVQAIPLKRANAKEIGGALFSHLFCAFGKPDRFHSDEGTEFVNEAMQKMCTLWGITWSSTGGYQPQANPVERFHRFLNSGMTMLSDRFGADWPQFLPAVVFTYNASTNDATGFSPHELVFGGRRATLLQDMGFHEYNALAPATSELHFVEAASQRLHIAYEQVRIQQERMAALNREVIAAKRGQRAMAAKFDVGDFVLFWEPRQVKMMHNENATGAAEETSTKAPTKWTRKWSGPHVITSRRADGTGYRYTFDHRERGELIETHVNKLCSYRPWSEGLGSTSQDIDAKRLYKCGGWVQNDALVVVPLQRPYPFGVALVLGCDDEGDLTLQWLSNASFTVKGPYKKGWTPPKVKKAYYDDNKRFATHVPYTTTTDGFQMNQRDVLMHGFELTEAQMLPAPVLRAIAKHPYVWWDPTQPTQGTPPNRPI